MKFADAFNRWMDFIDHVKFHLLLFFLILGLLGVGYYAVGIPAKANFGIECQHKAWEVLAALLLLITGRGATGAFNGNGHGNGNPPDPQQPPKEAAH